MKTGWLLVAGGILLAISFCAILVTGTVFIPIEEVFGVLIGKEGETPYISTIILQTRLPMAIAAMCCGAGLSTSGLLMQTLFQNPLAGPSVLGISSGASLGTAILMLGAGGAGFLGGVWSPVLSTVFAFAGGMAVIAVLYAFSSVLKSGATLLIVGIMVSYLCSSGISLLNYFAPADEMRNYLVWGLGSFSGLRLNGALWLLCFTAAALPAPFFFIKPLNAILLGERHLESVGFSPRRVRGGILIVTGLLVATATAFCGPIGFIGLITPHLCRLLFRTSNHQILVPASMIYGGAVGSLCALVCVLPSASFGLLPINVITPIIGVPVILYLLVNRNKLPYFS